jgi:tetratricopeptide (TPR) repeat protein
VRALVGLVLWTCAAEAFTHAQIGSVIPNPELPQAGGGKHYVLSNAVANVFIFFKPDQEHSRSVLRQLAILEREFATNSVSWALIASDRFSAANVSAEVRAAGLGMPALVDTGDAFYGQLGVVLSPAIGITDRDHKLIAYEPFAKVNYGAVVRARIAHLLNLIPDEELDRVLHPVEPVDDREAQAARRWLKLAERFLAATNYDLAADNARKSIALNTNSAAAHLLLGKILAAKGNSAGALGEVERALALEPTNTAALKEKEALSRRE